MEMLQSPSDKIRCQKRFVPTHRGDNQRKENTAKRYEE